MSIQGTAGAKVVSRAKASKNVGQIFALLCAAMIACLVLLVEPSWAQTSSSYALKVSTSSNRSSPTDLEGTTQKGNIYVFTSPDTSNISQVDFYLDDPNMTGTPRQTEKVAPYDFAGGSTTTANPFDTSMVSDGSHQISAKISFNDGTAAKTLSSSFTVKNTTSSTGQWSTLAPSSQNRQEVSYVKVDGKFYLAGGSTLQERYDPVANSWSTLKSLPANLDHIQGVELSGLIYYIGGLTSWPSG